MIRIRLERLDLGFLNEMPVSGLFWMEGSNALGINPVAKVVIEECDPNLDNLASGDDLWVPVEVVDEP